MKASRSTALAALALAAIAALPARGEVSAEVDPSGAYERTVILASNSARNIRIWTATRTRAGYVPLNPLGDLNGDLWPTVLENPLDGNKPWVVWSRFNGRDFDLAWSRFQSGAWTPVSPVETASATGDDLSPSLGLDTNGNAFLAWWRNENGIGRIYFSMFLITRWMPAFPVSDPGVDSINPVITILSDSRIRIDYDTPDGHVTRILAFMRPKTITDDITPFGSTSVESTVTAPTLH